MHPVYTKPCPYIADWQSHKKLSGCAVVYVTSIRCCIHARLRFRCTLADIPHWQEVREAWLHPHGVAMNICGRAPILWDNEGLMQVIAVQVGLHLKLRPELATEPEGCFPFNAVSLFQTLWLPVHTILLDLLALPY